MKKLQLTKKISEYSAYLWDGTVESYVALVKEIGNRTIIEYHLNVDTTWLSVHDEFTSQQHTLFTGQYLVFAEIGLEVMTAAAITNRFDIVVEKKVYTGSMPTELDAWNKSAITGDLDKSYNQ
jgi:hypothetical protein